MVASKAITVHFMIKRFNSLKKKESINMKRFFNVIGNSIILLTMLNVANAATAKNALKPYFGVIDQEMKTLIRNNHINGATIIVTNQRETLWSQAYGYTNKNRQNKVNLYTVFNVGSQSKLFTGLATVFAAQEHTVTLDQPIKKYIPYFSLHSRFGQDPMAQITLRMLISNHSGLPKFARAGNIFNLNVKNFTQHIDSIQNQWLQYPPGSRYSYSNIGYDLAAYILQQLTHTSFPSYVQQHIFTPFGMTRSSFDIRIIKSFKNRAIGQVPGLKNVPIYIPTMAGGQLYSDAVDMAKFIRFELNNGKTNHQILIKPAYFTQMAHIYNKAPGQVAGNGLGKDIIRVAKDVVIEKHDGGGYGFVSVGLWAPKLHLGIEIMANHEPDGHISAAVEEIAFNLISHAMKVQGYTHPLSFISKPKILTSAQNTKALYTGRYIYSQSPYRIRSFQIVARKNNLYIKKGQKITLLNPTKNQRFFFYRAFIPGRSHSLFTEKVPFTYQFIKLKKPVRSHIKNILIGKYYDYDGTPTNKKNNLIKPINPHYTGIYLLTRYNYPAKKFSVTEKNGYLFIGPYILHHAKDNLFFANNGWVAEFTKNGVYFDGIYMKKLSH